MDSLPTVGLLTDFGLTDTYVGQMKAALLRVAPQARLVDLTHAVPAQDVRAGAFLLWSAVEAFAEGSLHLAVVDPGVGSARPAVAARSQRGDVLVGPDNGLQVLHVDTYGNLITNLPMKQLPERFELQVGGIVIPDAPHAHYQAVAPGALLALGGSTGLLEVSVRDGDAARVLGVGRGARVCVVAGR